MARVTITGLLDTLGENTLSFALSLILLLWTVPATRLPSIEALISPPQTENTLCLMDLTGLPITVRFQESITLTQALRQAAIVRESIKNEVCIIRRIESGLIQGTSIDLRTIEKRKKADYRLLPYDIVGVIAKKKEVRANMEAIWAVCAVCGCQPIHGMHGPLVVPKARNQTPDPQEPDFNH